MLLCKHFGEKTEPLQHQERFAALDLQVSCACSPGGVCGHESQLPTSCAPLGSAGRGLLSPPALKAVPAPGGFLASPKSTGLVQLPGTGYAGRAPSFPHNRPQESCQQCSKQQETPAAPPLPFLLLAVLVTTLIGLEQSPRASLSL